MDWISIAVSLFYAFALVEIGFLAGVFLMALMFVAGGPRGGIYMYSSKDIFVFWLFGILLGMFMSAAILWLKGLPV